MDIKYHLSTISYGITKEEAHQKKICIDCKRPIFPLILTVIDKAEYDISGICPECWDKTFPEDD